MWLEIFVGAAIFIAFVAAVYAFRAHAVAQAAMSVIAKIASAEEKPADPTEADEWRRRVL